MRSLLCSLLFSSATLFGQSTDLAQAPARVPSLPSPAPIQLFDSIGAACPVGMKAERQASAQREWIVSLEDGAASGRTQDRRPFGAGVRVELIGAGNHPLSQAEVVVSYSAPGIHVLPVDGIDASTVATQSLKKTFVLSAANSGAARTLAASLLVGRTAGITRVQLASVTYADGTTWQPSKRDGCAVTPSLLMTVASR